MASVRGPERHGVATAGATAGSAQKKDVEGRPPLPHAPMGPFNWETLVAEMKLEARESRRTVEKKAQRLASLDNKLRAKVEANAEAVLAIQQVDRQMEEAVQREKRLHHLAAAAKQRKTQLKLDVEATEKKLEAILNQNQQTVIMRQGTATAVEPAATPKAPSDDRHPEVERMLRERHGVAELQQKLHETRTRYRKVCDENKKLSATLEGINAEGNIAVSQHNEYSRNSNSGIGEHHFAFSNALHDLIESFEAVKLAAAASE
ncbi:hypothetical protein DQ04_00551090 [Trypanosoma grayi]|uniref:hypothetical protein n=1 Tax=Trypanosoma grayi TaxID=71804 RepID=UPI0004F3F591|nr:hypothetical protein DQ04_00551090 [Trypanosoma grayi]KEG14257.1 hypothetical protein DQ04_00551090 [Trypanosoma grayi]